MSTWTFSISKAVQSQIGFLTILKKIFFFDYPDTVCILFLKIKCYK